MHFFNLGNPRTAEDARSRANELVKELSAPMVVVCVSEPRFFDAIHRKTLWPNRFAISQRRDFKTVIHDWYTNRFIAVQDRGHKKARDWSQRTTPFICARFPNDRRIGIIIVPARPVDVQARTSVSLKVHVRNQFTRASQQCRCSTVAFGHDIISHSVIPMRTCHVGLGTGGLNRWIDAAALVVRNRVLNHFSAPRILALLADQISVEPLKCLVVLKLFDDGLQKLLGQIGSHATDRVPF